MAINAWDELDRRLEAEGVINAIKYLVPWKGHISGLVPSNGSDATNDLDFTTGAAVDSLGTKLIVADSAFTKRADATWAKGTGNGGMASGETFGADTWHCHLLGNSTLSSSFDFGFDSSVTAVNLLADAAVIAAGFNIYRRVASFITTSVAWIPFLAQETSGGGLQILHKTVIQEFSDNNPGTSAVTKTLSQVPAGIVTDAFCTFFFLDTSPDVSVTILLTALDQTDTAPTSGIFSARWMASGNNRNVSQSRRIRTNTSGQIRYRLSLSDAGIYVQCYGEGWEDWRR